MLIRIVDDDEDLAESLKFLLEPEGWKVVSYLSAEDYLKSDAPSVEGCLLLDIRMPGLSGLELQEKMKERGCFRKRLLYPKTNTENHFTDIPLKF